MYHPLLAAPIVLLILTAYLLKTRKRQYFVAHYVAGVLAFSFFTIAVPIGLYEVASSGGLAFFPEVLIFHLANFLVAGTLIVTQTILGVGMLIFGRRRWVYAIHRRLSKYVVTIILLQGALGLVVYLLTFILTSG